MDFAVTKEIVYERGDWPLERLQGVLQKRHTVHPRLRFARSRSGLERAR